MLHEEALRIAQASPNNPNPPTYPAAWAGRWENQIESFMELTVAGEHVTGTYTSSNNIEDEEPVTGELKGYVSGDLISFLVLWPGGSITAWSGQLVDDQVNPNIKTLWHLVTDIPNALEPDKLWTTTLAGADVFHR